MKLVFATNNKNKLREVAAMLGSTIELLSLADIGCTEEIPETQATIAGNALQKAHYVKDKYGYNCFADDTGLEIEALNGEPGVYSARYAGEECNAKDNMNLVLQKLRGEKNRKARFKTVIALLIDDKEELFEGIVDGNILEEEHGTDGFGYDPIFQAEAYDISFAEMSLAKKNEISHRALATRKLIAYFEK